MIDGYQLLKDHPELVAAIERMAHVKIVFEEEKQMSFSFSCSEDADTAVTKIDDDKQLPQPVKDYLKAGIDALKKRYEDGKFNVSVSASGHLFNGEEGWSEVTSVSASVSKAS